MTDERRSSQLDAMIGLLVVLDLRSPYVCIGALKGYDDHYLELTDADLHDFRDSAATREVYVYDSARLGVRRNRAAVLIRRSEVVAVTKFSDVAES